MKILTKKKDTHSWVVMIFSRDWKDFSFERPMLLAVLMRMWRHQIKNKFINK